MTDQLIFYCADAHHVFTADGREEPKLIDHIRKIIDQRPSCGSTRHIRRLVCAGYLSDPYARNCLDSENLQPLNQRP